MDVVLALLRYTKKMMCKILQRGFVSVKNARKEYSRCSSYAVGTCLNGREDLTHRKRSI